MSFKFSFLRFTLTSFGSDDEFLSQSGGGINRRGLIERKPDFASRLAAYCAKLTDYRGY